MGLLALIFGHGINPEQLTFTKIAPLLILMGFVATTLSIWDPVGGIQRRIIKRADLTRFHDAKSLANSTIFGKLIMIQFPLSYIFAIAYSPEDLKRLGYGIDWSKMRTAVQIEKAMKGKTALREQVVKEINKDVEKELDRIAQAQAFPRIIRVLQGFKEQTVNTKWIKAEVDRITALVYFIIVISVFIVATLLYPAFLQKFAGVFQGNELTKLVILIASIAALAVVSYVFHRRISELRGKASIVHKYLTATGIIEVGREYFKDALQETERYLDNDNWTLAGYWVERIQIQYTWFFLEKVMEEKPKPFGVL